MTARSGCLERLVLLSRSDTMSPQQRRCTSDVQSGNALGSCPLPPCPLCTFSRTWVSHQNKAHDFAAGDEFYLKDWPHLTGYTFQEALVSFPAATPIGVKENASGKVVLNPEDDYIIQDGA